MPINDSDLKKILLGYEERRMQAAQLRDQHIREIYSKIPEIRRIDSEIESFGLNAMQSYLRNGRNPALAMSQLKSRTEELTLRKKELLAASGYPEDYMELHYTCPLCKDTGYVDYQRCRCLQQRLIDLAYDQSGLRRILARENRQVFDPSLFSDQPFGNEPLSPRENILRIFQEMMRSAGTFETSPGQNFLFCGSTGTGKTFLCNCVAKELLDRGHTVLYVTAYDLCERLEKERFRDRAREARLDLPVEFIYSCDLLIIDDLGTEFASSLSITELFHCINQRILDQRATLISTNLNLRELKSTYGDRLASRISGCYTVCRFYGPDLRIEKRRRKGGFI